MNDPLWLGSSRKRAAFRWAFYALALLLDTRVPSPLNRLGALFLAAALHRHLAEAPERTDPKRLRLRTDLDRELLQPAARRRENGAQGEQGD